MADAKKKKQYNHNAGGSGLSDSLWKSVAVKAVRIGWVDALQACEKYIGWSLLRYVLKRQTWEDIFPARLEIEELEDAIERRDYELICTFDTHHGKGLSEQFCDLEHAACSVWGEREEMKRLEAVAKDMGVMWIPKVANCFWTWLQLQSSIPVGKTREPWKRQFEGIPRCMADAHSYEGKVWGIGVTFLSGMYSKHRALGRMVMDQGWKSVRDRVESDKLVWHKPREARQLDLLAFFL